MNQPNPPRWPVRLLRLFCSEHVAEHLLGDMYELYEIRLKRSGKFRAQLHLVFDVLSSLRPSFIKSIGSNSNTVGMYIHYFKIAFRHLGRTKLYTSLNIFGLAIGMACSILILLWVENELSYDRFNQEPESIYRLTSYVDEFKAAVTPAGMGPSLNEQLPEIEGVLRLSTYQSGLIEYNDQLFEEERIVFADSNFFDFFSFKLIHGNKSTILNKPNIAVVTAPIANKYFGDDDPIGKTIKFNDNLNITIVGVLEGLPSNSHLKFDFLISTSTIAKTDPDLATKTWDNFSYYTYFRLSKNILSSESISNLEERISAIFSERKNEGSIKFKLQALTDIHLMSDLQIDLAEKGNMQYVRVFFLAALFILGIACINFMNLATARSIKRSKEVALRKTLGAERKQLIGQFLSESILITLISSLVAAALVFFALPSFNDIAGKNLNVDILETGFWIRFLIIVFTTGLLSGSYPALFLSSFSPLKVMKGELKNSSGNVLFRNTLVVTQFAISGILIVGTLVVYGQLNFIQGRNLGYDKENLVVMPIRGDVKAKLETLENSLNQNPLTEEYSIISDLPYDLITGSVSVEWQGKREDLNIVIPKINIDENFLKVFGINLIAGRGFSKDITSDDQNFIINETMMNLMDKNVDNIIGTELTYNGSKGRAIGVVEDFNFKSLQYKIEPLVLNRRGNENFAIVRTTVGQTQNCLESLAQIHEELNSKYSFTYRFLDQELEKQYASEKKMGLIFNLLAGLAILISCLGLYGLSAFITEQKTKQIGIRKVLGATILSLINLQAKGFFRLIFVALLIALPVAWLGMNRWLEDFAYHVNVSWWMLLIASSVVFVVTILTMSHQLVKAATTNPVDSLRDE